MAQISYGTITITDTNDVESIVVEYNRNQSTTTPPARTDSGWSTNRPTWAQGYYIWQRTRTHKSGTQVNEDILGNAVCLTGSTGQSGTPGKGITGIETLYATNNSATTAPTSGWQSQPPTYNSSKPKYWVKVTTSYNSGDPTVVTYLDNGITDAMATAAAANSSATEALSKTQAKYATSSTEATIPAKVAVFNPAVTTWSLFNGAEIFVKFTNKNNVANPTLSVKPSSSGSGTAAKTIRDSDGNALDSKFYWGDNSLVHFVYDGTYWRILDIVTTAKYNNMVSDIDGMSRTIGAHTTRLNGLDILTEDHESRITENADAITLRATKTEAYQLAQPNLSPWFSYSPYKVNDYWTTSSFNSLFTYTDMGDGWVRVQCTNSTSATVRSDPRPIRCESVQPNSDYTFLYEVRNNHSTIGSTTDSNIYVVQNNNSQFWGGNCKKNLEGDRSDTYIVIKNLPQDSSTPYIKRFVKTSEPEDSSHWTGTVDGLGAIVQRCAAGDTIDYELRISIYEGEYIGPYKPYSGTQLYASEAELKITNDNVLIKATKDDTTAAQGGQHLIQSLINVAPEGVKIAASKVEIDGSAIFSAISNDVNAAVSNVMTTGLGMKVNYSGFATVSDGECYFHGYNNQNEEADINGWVIWNGEKLTITKGMWINPNGAVPVNTPIFHVFRTSASPYHSDVWWDSSLLTWRGYAYTTDKVPGTKVNWTWNEATDCILAVYVATGNEAISSAQLFTTPKKFSELPNPSDIQNIVNTSIDSIEIGGRNILRDSESMSSKWYYSKTNATLVDGVVTLTGTSSSWTADLWTSKFESSVYDGAESIISFDYKSTASCDIHRVYAGTSTDKDDSTWGRTKYIGTSFTIPSSSGEWKRYVMPVNKISVASLTTGSGDVVSGYLQFYNRTDNTVFQMRHIKFEKGNKATQWMPAPEDMVAQEQRIYYRTNTTSAPDAPLTWVTSTTTANDTWTTKRMQYDKDHPYLFTCIQRLNIGGIVSNTDVLLDDTTTVIDGGHIITGTVDANQIAANAVTADKIAANAITAGKIATDAIHSRTYNSGTGIYSTEGMGIDLTGNGSIKSPNFAIDANGNAYFNGQLTATSLVIAPGAVVEGDASQMLSDVYAPSLTRIDAKYNRYFSDAANTSTECSFISAGNEVLPDPNANYFVRIKNTELNKYRALCFYGSANYENAIGMVVGGTYKVSCWVRQLEGNSNFLINLGGLGGKDYTDTAFVPSTEWQKYEKVFTFTDYNKATSTVWSRLYFYNRAGAEINGAGTGIGQIDMCGFKLERIDATTASGRNLCLRTADYNGWGKSNGTTFNGNIITFPTVTSDTWREAWQKVNLPYSIIRNQKVTITYKIKGTADQLIGSAVRLGLVASETSDSWLKYVNRYHYVYATGDWQTVAVSAYINDFTFINGSDSPNYNNCYFNIKVGALGNSNGRNGFQMKEVMVTLGSDPCAWSPAPEDSVIYTNESVDSLEIGGRNLVKGTSDEWYSSTITDGTNKNINLFGLANVHEPLYIEDIPDIKVGDKIQVSFDIKFSENWVATGTGTKSSIVQGNKNHNSTPWTSISYTGGNKKTELETIMASTSKEGHITTWFLVTQDMIDGTYSGQLNSNIRFDYYSGTVFVRRIMVEKGDKATTWAPAPEDETNARKLLIREITSGNTQGIEVGYENGSYKAFINAAGSFDVINAAGETVASFSETSTMRSVRTETWDVNGVESEVEVEAWQQLTPDGTQFYKREHSIDEDFSYDKSQSTIIDAYGIKPQGSGAIFTLGANVRAPNETRLWHMKTGNGDYMIEGAWFGAGYITTQKKKVAFTIPLAIPVVEGASVSCYMMDATMRQGGKYIFGDPDSTEDISPSYVIVSTCPSGLNISIDFPSALTDATNNDVVGIVCNYYISVGSL